MIDIVLLVADSNLRPVPVGCRSDLLSAVEPVGSSASPSVHAIVYWSVSSAVEKSVGNHFS